MGIRTVFLDVHCETMMMKVCDVKMTNSCVDLRVSPKHKKQVSWHDHAVQVFLHTFRDDRPLETMSFVLIRFVDELDGETSTIPDPL